MTKAGWALVTAAVVCLGLLSGVLGTSAVAPPRSVQSTASAVVATPWTPHIAAVDARWRPAISPRRPPRRRKPIAPRWPAAAGKDYSRPPTPIFASPTPLVRPRPVPRAPASSICPRSSALATPARVDGVVRAAQAFDRLGDARHAAPTRIRASAQPAVLGAEESRLGVVALARTRATAVPVQRPIRRAAGADEVDDDVLAELVGGGEEGAAVVDAGHLLDEAHQPRSCCSSMKVLIVMPSRVQRCDFLERLLERALRWAGRRSRPRRPRGARSARRRSP